LIFGIILIFFIIGFWGLNEIRKTPDNKTTLTNEQINKVESNLNVIFSTSTHSSNPFDQVKGHEKEYDEIIQMGEPAVNYFVDNYKSGELETGREWLTAWICNEILGDKNPIKIWAEDNKNGWDSGSDWYDKYIKINNTK
jgi:hypothetical protein